MLAVMKISHVTTEVELHALASALATRAASDSVEFTCTLASSAYAKPVDSSLAENVG